MQVAPKSPLSLSGIRPGDYILAIDGKAVNTAKDMRTIIDSYKPGDKVVITYEHDGETQDTEVLLAKAPEGEGR